MWAAAWARGSRVDGDRGVAGTSDGQLDSPWISTFSGVLHPRLSAGEDGALMGERAGIAPRPAAEAGVKAGWVGGCRGRSGPRRRRWGEEAELSSVSILTIIEARPNLL